MLRPEGMRHLGGSCHGKKVLLHLLYYARSLSSPLHILHCPRLLFFGLCVIFPPESYMTLVTQMM